MKNIKNSLGVVLFCLAMNVQAGFVTGNDLVADMREHEKSFRTNFLATGRFAGYVMGVADSNVDVLFCPRPISSQGQVMAIVTNFLHANPARLAEPANVLVVDALIEAFPCKKSASG